MENPSEVTLGERLSWLIKHRGHTATQVSKATGVPNSTLSELCGTAGRHPRAGHFLALCEFLGVQPEWLLYGRGPMNTYTLNEEELRLVHQFRLLDPRAQGEFFGMSAQMLMRQREALDSALGNALAHFTPKEYSRNGVTMPRVHNLVTESAPRATEEQSDSSLKELAKSALTQRGSATPARH